MKNFRKTLENFHESRLVFFDKAGMPGVDSFGDIIEDDEGSLATAEEKNALTAKINKKQARAVDETNSLNTKLQSIRNGGGNIVRKTVKDVMGLAAAGPNKVRKLASQATNKARSIAGRFGARIARIIKK